MAFILSPYLTAPYEQMGLVRCVRQQFEKYRYYDSENIFNHWGNMPRNRWGWGVFVGYEDFGKTLLYMNSDIPEPEKILFSELFPEEFMTGQDACNGWILPYRF